MENEWYILIIWAAASGILNLLIGERSRVDAWALRNPRLASILKAIRAIGIDPWLLVSALNLLVKKQLPKTEDK